MAIDLRSSIAHEKPLTEEDLAAFTLGDSTLLRIEAYRLAHDLEKADMRILDWGCGRGRTVLWLRERGYQAYGVDIEAEPVENGRLLAGVRGLDAERVLTVLDETGRSVYPDGFFHFTCSNQVFEHIEHLSRVTGELSRVTMSGGGGVHIFPGPHYLVEGHLYMPLVHWLPKNALRHALIRMWVAARVEAKLPAYEGLDPRARARKFYRFSVENTYYRSFDEVARAFRKSGVRATLASVDSPTVRRHRVTAPLASHALLRPLLNRALGRFVTIHLMLDKPAV